jgi:site-specific recombinase
MVAQAAAGSDPVTRTAAREYRLSLALLSAGVVLLVAVALLTVGGGSAGNHTSSFWNGLSTQIAETAGFMLILLAGTVAYFHRSFLRRSRRNP